MPMVDLGGTDYPAFTSVEDADTFLAADVLRAAPWALRQPETKARGVISATRLLLRMPWVDAPPAFDAAPPVVAEVTAMLAADLLAKPKLLNDASSNSNVRSAQAGPARVEFFRRFTDGPPLPSGLWAMLLAAGLVSASDIDSGNAGPIVTGISGDDCRPDLGRYAYPDFPYDGGWD